MDRLRRRNSGNDRCQADICESLNLELNEKPTVMATKCPAIALPLRVSATDRFLNRRYLEHLERNEQKSIEDLREDIS